MEKIKKIEPKTEHGYAERFTDGGKVTTDKFQVTIPLTESEEKINEIIDAVNWLIEREERKTIPSVPRVSIHYQNGVLDYARANCRECGALLYQTTGLLPLRESIDGERPFCQHCGQLQSADFSIDENDYVCGI